MSRQVVTWSRLEFPPGCAKVGAKGVLKASVQVSCDYFLHGLTGEHDLIDLRHVHILVRLLRVGKKLYYYIIHNTLHTHITH